jgi:undecaprenyl-diphosphatase
VRSSRPDAALRSQENELSHLSYVEAIVVGAFQGVTELFPVSSLGHSVLVPALVGGSWARDLNVSTPESPYLAYIVGLHVATAAALLVFFRREWVAVVSGFVTSILRRRVDEPAQRLAWLIVLATIPVGLSGLALEHLFRSTLGRPVPAAAFLVVNAVVLLLGERLRRRTPLLDAVAGRSVTSDAVTSDAVARDALTRESADPSADPQGARAVDVRLAGMTRWQAVLIGSAQILALLPGISRSGTTMVAGLVHGLSHEEAARFSFLLATPVILAAGVLKIPDLFGPLGDGIRGQVLAGSVASFVSAYLAVRFLTRWFHTRTLIPFAVYCAVAGAGSLIWLAVSR